jgi:hypothetical protein
MSKNQHKDRLFPEIHKMWTILSLMIFGKVNGHEMRAARRQFGAGESLALLGALVLA